MTTLINTNLLKLAIPPKHFLSRPEYETLKAMVLQEENQPIVITDTAEIVGEGITNFAPGRAGIGKSALIAALAHDPQITQTFSDGILLMTLGQNPDLIILQVHLAMALKNATSIPPPIFENLDTGKAWLRNHLQDHAFLLILDDVRAPEHCAAFTILGPRGRLVLTARNSPWLISPDLFSNEIPQEKKERPVKKKSRPARQSLNTPTNILSGKREILTLPALTDEQALTLLAAWAEQPLTELPPAALDVAHECGNLPLALAMMGALAQKSADIWNQILLQITALDSELLRRKFIEEPYYSPYTLRALQVAINALTPELQRYYLDLAIFPENVFIPVAVLRALWVPEESPLDNSSIPNHEQNKQKTGLEENIVEKISENLAQRALVQRHHDGSLRLHELQRAYLQKYAGNRSALHLRFLRNVANQFVPSTSAFSHRSGALIPWHTLSRDEFYFWQYLHYHLAHAGEYAELVKLLTDFNWLLAQLEIIDILTLRAAYTLAPPDEGLHLVQEVLRLATPILSKDPAQLAGQLLGRLLGLRRAGLHGLIKQATHWKGSIWLRPLTDSLIVPRGALEHTLENQRERIRVLSILDHPGWTEGRLLITGSTEGRIKIWDMEQWIELHTLLSKHGAINGMALLPDNRRILLATDDGTLELWDLTQREILFTLKSHYDRITAVAILKNGRQAISGAVDGTLKIWNLEQRTVLYTLKAIDSVSVVAVLPNGIHVLSAAGNIIQIWDLTRKSEKQNLVGHLDSVSALAITQDGRRAISGSHDKTLKIWNLESGSVIHTLKGHNGAILALTVTPDGQWIISTATDGTLKVWDLERGIERCSFSDHHAEVWAIAVTNDGRAISTGADRTIKIWDLERGADLHTLTGHRDAVNSVALLPGGTQIISASDDHTLKVWDIKWRGAALRILAGHIRDVNAIAVTTDGQRAVSASKDKTLKVWDLEAGREIYNLVGHDAPVRAVAFSTDGRRVISGSSDRTLRIWDVTTQNANCLRTLSGHQGAVTAIAVVRAGNEILSASLDGTLKLWDLEHGTELQSLMTVKNPSAAILALAVPPLALAKLNSPCEINANYEKQWAITGVEDGTIQIWALTPGRGQYIWAAHAHSVTAVAVTADGRRVISGSSDHTIRVWSFPRGVDIFLNAASPPNSHCELLEIPNCIAEFTGESAILTCVVAADGVTIIAGEKSGRIHFLRLEGLN